MASDSEPRQGFLGAALRAETSVPFAREAPALFWGEETVTMALKNAAAPGAGLRRIHFEKRYRSIDTLLAEAGIDAIVELGGGLSFRGLEMTRVRPVFYLDTDLATMAAIKADLVAKLHPTPGSGRSRSSRSMRWMPAPFMPPWRSCPRGRSPS